MTEPIELEVARNQPVKSVVDVLEDWLEDAKSGQLRGLLLVGDMVENDIRRAYVGEYRYSDMVYACELAKADLLAAAKESDRPVERDK